MRSLRRSVEKSARDRDRRFRRAVSRAVGIGLVFTAGSALAQSPPSEEIPLTPVDVRAQRREYRIMEPSLFKFPDLIKDTPQAITVIPQEILREQAVFSLRESLRNVTGLSLNAGEGGIQGDNLTLRGYSARNDIYLDGIRDWGSYTRDVFNLQSVEVLKGPSSVMFGRGSTGGLINQVEKAPERTPFYDFSATIGAPLSGRIAADLNQPFSEQMAGRFNAMYYQGEVAGRDEVEFQRYGVAPSLTVGMTGPTRLTLSYFMQKESNTPDNGLPYLFGRPAPVDRSTFYGLPDNDFFKTTVNIGTIRLDHAFNDDLKLRNTLRYANYHLEQEAVAPRIAGAPTPTTPLTSITVNRGIVARDRTDDILANQTDFVITFDTWGLEHTLVTGAELDRETTGVTTFTVTGVPTASLVDPNPFPNLATIRRAVNTVSGTTAFTASLYAVDEIAIAPRWKLLGGFRYDHFDADFESRSAVTGARIRFNRVDDVVSPRAALVFLPTKEQTYYFAWGTAFNPSAEALTLAANTVNTAPEKTQSFELGAKWQLLGDRLQNALFITAALPLRVFPPLFNRYEPGMTFGAHVDNAIRQVPGTPFRIRTDLSVTLFVSRPEEYDGGELIVEDAYGAHSVKLPAGDLILYPATSLHRVTPVTRGARYASFFWIQSMVRDDGQRSLLFDLDVAINQVNRAVPDHPGVVALTSCYHNLLRRWAES